MYASHSAFANSTSKNWNSQNKVALGKKIIKNIKIFAENIGDLAKRISFELI